MGKKRSLGVTILSWYLMVSSLWMIIASKVLVFLGDSEQYLVLNSILMKATLIINFSAPIMRGIRSENFVLLFNIALNVIIIICGYGLLKLNDRCRKIIITLCTLSIISVGVEYIKYNPFMFLWIQMIFCLTYIIYLTRLKVKEQFK